MGSTTGAVCTVTTVTILPVGGLQPAADHDAHHRSRPPQPTYCGRPRTCASKRVVGGSFCSTSFVHSPARRSCRLWTASWVPWRRRHDVLMAIAVLDAAAEWRAPLIALAESQDDVVSRRQLARLDVSRHQVSSRVRCHRWQFAGHQVVVLHPGPLTARQRRWAAVLSFPGLAALAGLTAAIEHGLTGFESEAIHVVVRAGTRVATLPGLIVHLSRRFAPGDLHPTRKPPQVRVDRALVDAAAWSATPRGACAILAAAVQQRLTTVPRLADQLDRAGQIRHCAVLAAVLRDIDGGSQSLAEIDFYRLCRRFRLPPPQRQRLRVDARGRRRYLDADFGNVVVEVDGALHLRPLDWWADMARQNELAIDGRRVLRFPSLVIRTQPQVVAEQLRRALPAS